jgi:DNA-binding transcriptional MerR regulator
MLLNGVLVHLILPIDTVLIGFSLEEIRQLLNLYDIGDQQKTQLLKTYELANERLKVMMNQKDELELAIEDLKKMLKWGEEVLISRGIKSNKN